MTSTADAQPVAAGALVLGIDVGGTSMKGAITAADGAIVARDTRATPRGAAALDAVAALGEFLLDGLDAAQRDRVVRGAVLLPGIVDAARGIAVFSGNIGWRDRDVSGLYAQRWGFPVLIDHDVTAAGWAEWQFGAGAGHDDVCVVVLGTGVSGALAVGGRLVRGGSGQAGEYGHIVVRPDGRPCVCGNVGCLETVASAAAIGRRYAERAGIDTAGAADVFRALETDAVARAVWDEAIDALADGLLGVIHAACPELLVIAGGLSSAGPALTVPLQAALQQRVRVVAAPRVVLGRFGIDAGLVAAGQLARRGRESTIR